MAARLMAAALMILGGCPPGAWGFPAGALLLLPFALMPLTVEAAASANTCGSVKSMYKAAGCCGNPDKSSNLQVVPAPSHKLFSTNVCAGKKPKGPEWDNVNCMQDTVVQVMGQAGANVTKGYVGGIASTTGGDGKGIRFPITDSFLSKGLCPINVHWHLGGEHLSVGEFDEDGTGPSDSFDSDVRLGPQCHKYDKTDAKFTTAYDWQHCTQMHVGETYEMHWAHSSFGACGTPYQYQTPFYDGLFCEFPADVNKADLAAQQVADSMGVQAQVFVIVNDENYYYPDLMRGMIVDGDYGKDVAHYTGSTTGTSRSNEKCSQFSPVTWQVDRKCHLISASSFDKVCADMKTQSDDMSGDLRAHGSRMIVANHLAANNLDKTRP